MRVGLDARTLAADVRSGVEHYVANLVKALSCLEDAPEIIAYTDRPIPDPEVAAAASSGPIRTHVIRARHSWLRAALPWRLWRDRADLVHLPSTIMPPLLPCPAVVTVHDLAWVTHPETYDSADLAMQKRAVSTASVRAAEIVTVSESTAHDLRRHYPGSQGRISVVPLAASPQFSPQGPDLSSTSFPGAERLAGGYLLYAGALQPRKNLLRLLAAYAKALQTQPAPPLVLAGPPSAHADELRAAARRLGVERRVLLTGYVADQFLPALYRGATVFVYPSLYEGFGLPVLEAMASGVPVVTSNVSSMPEVAGDGAVLVDPESVEQLAWAISVLLTDSDFRASLIRRGLQRSREFSWERTARQTVEVYWRAVRKAKPAHRQ